MKNTDQASSVLSEWVRVFMRHSMQDFILFLKTNGLSMTQIGALFQIRRKGARGVSDIADELGVTSAAASQLLDRLFQQGLIGRSEDPHDRRAKQIVLTEKGEQVLERSIEARNRWINSLAEMLTPEEQVRVIAGIHILIEKANQLETIPEG